MMNVPTIESSSVSASAGEQVRFWSSLLGILTLAWAGLKKLPPISTHDKVIKIESTLIVHSTKLESIDRNVNSLIVALGANPKRKKR